MARRQVKTARERTAAMKKAFRAQSLVERGAPGIHLLPSPRTVSSLIAFNMEARTYAEGGGTESETRRTLVLTISCHAYTHSQHTKPG